MSRTNRAPGRATATVLCPAFPYPPTSGGVKRTLRLLECMQRAGLAVEVLTDDRPEASAVAGFASHGIPTVFTPPSRSPQMRRLEQHVTLRSAPRSSALTRELRRAGHLTQLESLVAATHLGRVSGRPLIFSTHNVDERIARDAQSRTSRISVEGQRRRYHAHRISRLERATARRADVVLCVSQADAEALEPYSRRVIEAPNGVDEAFFAEPNPLPDNEDLLFFGQFTYEPNHEGLIRFLADGWPQLAALRPAARLLIAGQGSDDVVLGGVASAERVRVLGLVPDIAQTLAACRLSLVPIWSGGGTRLKVLEALAARRPVVGTTLGVSGIGFRSGEHGLVADAPADLARATASLLRDGSRLTAMADAGRELARRFEWTVALAPAEAVYRDYASLGGAGPRAGGPVS